MELFRERLASGNVAFHDGVCVVLFDTPEDLRELAITYPPLLDIAQHALPDRDITSARFAVDDPRSRRQVASLDDERVVRRQSRGIGR